MFLTKMSGVPECDRKHLKGCRKNGKVIMLVGNEKKKLLLILQLLLRAF